MAAHCGHGSARIKVQVVSTLRPFNMSIHVDPFWTLVKCSESPMIRDVENKLLMQLNTLARESSVELIALDTGHQTSTIISPSWTSLCNANPGMVPQESNIFTSEQRTNNDATSQWLSAVLKPRSYGSKFKAPQPVLANCNISHLFPKSVRLKFKRQLIWMRDCILLKNVSSEILRDDDVITIGTICDFYTSNSDECPQEGNPGFESASQSELQTESDSDSCFSAADRSTQKAKQKDRIHDFEEKLSVLQREEFRTFLTKLSSVPYSQNVMKDSNKDQNGQKARKRKAKLCEGEERESGDFTSGWSGCNDVEGDIGYAHSKSAKRKKMLKMVSDDVPEGAILQMTIDDAKLKKLPKKHKHSKRNEKGSHDITEKASSHQDKGSSNLKAVIDMSTENGRGKKKKKMKRPDSQMNFCNSNGSDSVSSQTAPHRSGVDETEFSKNISVNHCKSVYTTGIQPGDSGKTSSAAEEAGTEISDYLQSLINQRRDEICHQNALHETPNSIVNTGIQESGAQIGKQDFDQTVTAALIRPKRKRKRKGKKNKKCEIDAENSLNHQPALPDINRDFSLKLPEHQRPQNNRVMFNCDSEEEETSLPLNHNDHEQHSIAASCHESSQLLKSKDITSEEKALDTPKSLSNTDPGKSPGGNTGTPVNPAEKFQALLSRRGKSGRQLETVSSEDGHMIFRSLRPKYERLSPSMAAAQPEHDVLTNHSIIAECSPVQRSATPKSSHTTPGACIDIASHSPDQSSDGMLQNGPTSICPKKDFTPHFSQVEVTPLYLDYSRYEKLTDLPRKGDVIAYKILELSEDYTPALSDYKEAIVIAVDDENGSLDLELRGRIVKKRRFGRFELNLEDGENELQNGDDENKVTVSLDDMIEKRLVSRPNGT